MTQAFEKLERFDDVDGSREQAKFLAFLDRIEATELPLGDASVDAYRAERVYQHIADLRGERLRR